MLLALSATQPVYKVIRRHAGISAILVDLVAGGFNQERCITFRCAAQHGF